MNNYGGGNYNPYSTTSYGSNGPAHGGGFYNQAGGGAGFDDSAGGGGFGSPGSASKVRRVFGLSELTATERRWKYSSSSNY